jgi:hypothetical protein
MFLCIHYPKVKNQVRLQFSLQNSKKSAFPKPLHPQPRGYQPDESQNLSPSPLGPTGSSKLPRANQNHGGKGDRLGTGRAYGVVAAGAGVGVAAGVVLLVVVYVVVQLLVSLLLRLLELGAAVLADDLDDVVVVVVRVLLVLRLVAEEVLHHLVPGLLLDVPLPVAARHRRRGASPPVSSTTSPAWRCAAKSWALAEIGVVLTGLLLGTYCLGRKPKRVQSSNSDACRVIRELVTPGYLSIWNLDAL